MRSHKLEHKPSKQKRKFARSIEAAGSDLKALKHMLGVKK
jgi:ribosomal protein L35